MKISSSDLEKAGALLEALTGQYVKIVSSQEEAEAAGCGAILYQNVNLVVYGIASGIEDENGDTVLEGYAVILT